MFQQMKNRVGRKAALKRDLCNLLFYGFGSKKALLERRSRLGLPMPAPAHGLTLEQVYYRTGWGGRYDHPLHTDMVGSGGAEVDEPES